MPFGLVLLLLVILFLVSGHGEAAAEAMALSVRGAVLFLAALILSYLIPPLESGGVSAYWLPLLLCLLYAVYAFTRQRRRVRTFACAILSSLLLALLSFLVPVQPVAALYEPLAIYALVCALIALFLVRDGRAALFLCLASFLVFQVFLLFTGRLTQWMGRDVISAVCLSALLSVPPARLLFLRRANGYRRVLEAEYGNLGKIKRKRFKK